MKNIDTKAPAQPFVGRFLFTFYCNKQTDDDDLFNMLLLNFFLSSSRLETLVIFIPYAIPYYSCCFVHCSLLKYFIFYFQMSDEIELNVDTLEPDEEEEGKAIDEEEYSCGVQRVPMRKPSTLVQYWINTGNPPYKVLLSENELSETSSSLSEKESNPPLASTATNIVNAINAVDADDKRRNDSSCSSVDTAAYILSNANVTKKADTIAIIEGAKCIVKDVSVKDMGPSVNDKVECRQRGRSTRIDRATHDDHDDDDNINVDVSDTELYPVLKRGYTTLEMSDGTVAGTLVSADAIQSNICSQSLSREETNKADELNTSQRSLDVQSIDDIASIFQQFDKTSKRLIGNDKSNDVSDIRDKAPEMDTFHERQVSESIAFEIIAKDTTAFHRKKLYTGRDSPVDLILTETHGTSRLSQARQSLHPALDPDSMGFKREPLLVRRGKNKRPFSAKRNLDSKREGREPCCISSKAVTDINNKYTNDDMIPDSNIDSLKSLSDNSDRRPDDIPFRERVDTDVPVEKEKCKQNLASLDLQPVVLLERLRIKPFFKRRKLKFGKDTYVARKRNVHNNDRRLNKLTKLYSCQIENLEVEAIDSDESTILICQCNVNASQCLSSLNDCSHDLRSNIEDDFSASYAEEKSGQPATSTYNTNMSQNKELQVAEGLPRLLTRSYTTMEVSQVSSKNNAGRPKVLSNKSRAYSHLYGRNKIDCVKLREIKVVLERLPLSARKGTMMKTQALNDDISEEEIKSNQSETHFSDRNRANEKKNGKLGELRVILERLPANVCLKKISNVTGTNIFSNKRTRNTKISQSLQNNRKRDSPIFRQSSKILARKKGESVRSARNSYSLRINSKSKKHGDEADGTFDIVAKKNENQVFDKTESDSTFQQETFRHKSHSEVSQDNCCNKSKQSVLTFISDEDDFARSIQRPRKRPKVSDDEIIGEPSIAEKNICDQTKLVTSVGRNKDRLSKNSSTAIRSSERIVQRNIGSIREKKTCGGALEIKSFDGTTTSSLLARKNERFVFFSSEDDNDSAVGNLSKRNIRVPPSNGKRKEVKVNSKNRKQRSNGAMKKNGVDRKNVHMMFFQTNTFDTNSSDSEGSNGCTSSAYKALTSSSIRNRLRYRRNRTDRTNSDEIFNDSIASKCNERHSDSSNSSLEEYNRIHHVRTRSRSIGKEAKANEQLVNGKSNSGIKSRISDARKVKDVRNSSSSSSINDVRNPYETQYVREKVFSNIFFEETNLDRSLSKDKEISDKSNNSPVILQNETCVTSMKRKLLTFQTKSYYDSSDSSEIL